MKTQQAASVLRQTEFFGNLDQEALVHVADRAVERVYKRGQLIFHEGDLGDALCVVVEGLVKVFVTSEQGDEMVLNTLGAPETFGELALIDGGRRSASVETLETTRVLLVTRSSILELLRQQPEVTDTLLRSLGALVRKLTEQLGDLVFLDLHGRVAKALLALAEKQGAVLKDGVSFELVVSQGDLARMVGGSRQRVNQILRFFEGRGYLTAEGRTIHLKRVDLLRARASP